MSTLLANHIHGEWVQGGDHGVALYNPVTAAELVRVSSTGLDVHIVAPDVSKTHTGRGNVMPMSLHGGPGRAGGGEEFGGVRALALYHQRTVIQASRVVVDHLSQLPLISG
jgi:hypothetical protein